MDVANLIEIVVSAAKGPSASLPQDVEARKELNTALQKLSARLEDPVDSIFRFLFQVNMFLLCWETTSRLGIIRLTLNNHQPHQNAVIRIAVALDLFTIIEDKKESGISAKEIAKLTGAEQALIGLSHIWEFLEAASD